jgi:pimeloyl-ACP methyl ester carboxylesterase
VSEPLPIVLIPGLLASARLYAPQLPRLWQQGAVMIADHTRDDSLSALAQRILASAPARFALVGLSMGGYIALEIMRQAPQRVLRLALLDTSARADTPEQTAMRRAHMSLAAGGRFSEVKQALFLRAVHREQHGDERLREIVDLMADEVGIEAYTRQQRAIISRPDSRPTLKDIRCPTLVVVGEGDELTPPQLAEEIAAAITGAQLVTVPDSGHLSTLEQPQAVTDALLTWLRS